MTKNFVITFAGDTSLGDWYLKKPNRKKELERLNHNPSSFFEGVRSLVQSSDHFILNLETVLAEKPSGFIEGKQYPNHDNPKRTLYLLKELGVSAVSLANNHTMDFGPKVMMQTIKQLNKAGIESYGAGKNLKEAAKPLKIKLKGEKNSKNIYLITGMRASKRYTEDYGFIAEKRKPGVNSLNLEEITNEIKRIRKRDSKAIIVVSPHWQGLDYKWVSSKIKKRCRKFLEEGADFVFAHGTHMANHIEKNKNGTIVYSIGNFVFNSPGRYKKLQAPPYSLITKLQITENKGEWSIEPEFYPIVTDNRLTDFNVRKVNKLECNELLNILNTKIPQKNNNILENRKINNTYYYKLVNPANSVVEKNNFLSGFNLKDYIMGNAKVSHINLTNGEVFNDHIQQLNQLHNKIDNNFYNYYEKLRNDKHVRKNKKRLHKLSEIVKTNYLSHRFVKNFERQKIKLNNAISFRKIIVEKSQLRRLNYKEYSWKLDKKPNAYPFIESIGVRIPNTDQKVYKLSEIDEPTTPVVIKPIRSTGSAGVYLIFNQNVILSARTGVYLNSWNELQTDALNRLKNREKGESGSILKDEWMIEELILSDPNSTVPPSDLKFYCFYGEVVLILETNRLNKNVCFWDPDMNLIYPHSSKQFYVGKGFTKEHLDIVSEASLKIPTPYIRLDMLNGHDGLVFGEATPRPGAYHLFNDEYDQKLGEAYRRAEERLTRDLLKGKKFDEFKKHFNI